MIIHKHPKIQLDSIIPNIEIHCTVEELQLLINALDSLENEADTMKICLAAKALKEQLEGVL